MNKMPCEDYSKPDLLRMANLVTSFARSPSQSLSFNSGNLKPLNRTYLEMLIQEGFVEKDESGAVDILYLRKDKIQLRDFFVNGLSFVNL